MTDYLFLPLPNVPPKCSGRGVRFTLLSPTERDQVLLAAATLAGTDKAKLAIERQREGVRRMIRQITRKKGLSEQEMLDPATEWIDMNPEKLAMQYDELFTSKDDELISYFYRDYHEGSQEDVDAIAGKVRTVSVG